MRDANYEEKIQRDHYDSIGEKYGAHYGDISSQKYRHKFINLPMFQNINLSGAKVIDGLCGNGESSEYLLEKNAQVTGIDISQEEINRYRSRFPRCLGVCTSILATGLESNSYDCVTVVGGLHHLHPNVHDGIKEIHRILKRGGFFCFAEPHKGSIPDLVRRLWYRADNLFAENEKAVDLIKLEAEFSSKFNFIKKDFKGNIAYLFVLNSMVFRIPLKLKLFYSPFLIWMESIIEKVQGKLFSCFVVCQWKKT